LEEERAPFRFKTAGQEIDRHLPAVLPQRFGIPQAGQRMIIRDEVKCLAFGLECDRRLDHSEVIADMQIAARLDAG
jgi:hypothetical protein